MNDPHDEEHSGAGAFDNYTSSRLDKPTVPNQIPPPSLKVLFRRHGTWFFWGSLALVLVNGALIFCLHPGELVTYFLAVLLLITLMIFFFATYEAWPDRTMLFIPSVFTILFIVLTNRSITLKGVSDMAKKAADDWIDKEFSAHHTELDSLINHKLDSLLTTRVDTALLHRASAPPAH
jgi:hypothetical protein